MNSNNTPAIIRSLIIYAVCIPLAIWIGYLLAEPADRATFGIAGILLLLFLTPILLRWHHFLLIAGWNFSMTIFFLPGTPPVWLLLTVLSLGISVLQRTVNSRGHFLSAPEITRPLLFLLAVTIVTAKLTGGIGLHSLGNNVAGGKHYVTLIGGILAYFALTALRIPPKQVSLYIGGFFLAGFSDVIGDLLPYLPSSLHFIFAFFPVNGYDLDSQMGLSALAFHARYAGMGSLGVAGFLFMLSRYGARGLLLSDKPWRIFLFGLFAVCVLFGGFRSSVILCGLIFAIQFFMERLHRTRIMPVFIFIGLIAVALLIPFANKLPYTFQRSLAFLPLKIIPSARLDAEASEDWRLEIWRDTLPKVPQYLLLGKGYAISQAELAISSNQNFAYISTAEAVSISGNYHSGPLSVLMPFGIWGAIGLIWFWFASIRVLYANLRYGDPAFQIINTFLFAYFVAKVLSFLVIFGALEGDMAAFAVLIGLSISINGGIRRPVTASVPVTAKIENLPLASPQFQPVYQR
jgi:hypothetical protein